MNASFGVEDSYVQLLQTVVDGWLASKITLPLSCTVCDCTYENRSLRTGTICSVWD